MIRKDKLEKIVLETINSQIKLVMELNKKLECINAEENINYDEEIIKSRIVDIQNSIERYTLLKTSIKEDFLNKMISTEEFEEYENDYNNNLKKLISEKAKNEKELKDISNPKSNQDWINKFIEVEKVEKLNKNILNDLIDKIIISNNKGITIQFKFQDEYFEAIDFINKKFCDIISVSV